MYKTYEIITGTKEHVAEKVNQMMGYGWVPTGGIAVLETGEVCQALVHPEFTERQKRPH